MTLVTMGKKIKSEDGEIKVEPTPGKPSSSTSFDKDKGKGKSNMKRHYENTFLDSQGKPDWKRMRAEQKKLKETRKMKDMKPQMYQLSKQAKTIWEELRKDSCPETVRTKLCQELHELVKNHIQKLSYAHDTVRVLESLLMYGSSKVKENIHAAFSNEAEFLLLMKSKYGHFLALRLIKYASQDQRNGIYKRMEAHILSLLKHQFASQVLNEFYLVYAKAVQKSGIIKECYAPLLRLEEGGHDLKQVLIKFPQRRGIIMNNVKELIDFMLEKGMKTNTILHALIHEYLENCQHSEREELITIMREEVVNILHTHEGAMVGVSCLWHGTPKDRKVIIKSFKGFIPKIACDKNGHKVLLAAVDVVDDVVLLSKSICTEMLNNINSLVMHAVGQKTVAYILEHRTPLFFDPEQCKFFALGDNNEYTKKAVNQRLEDLTEPIEQEFLDSIYDNFGMWIKNNGACLVAELILKRYSGIPTIKALEKIAECITEIPTAEGIEKRPVEMLCKFILLNIKVEERILFANALLKSLESFKMTKSWLQTNRGCLTLLRIWENCGSKTNPGQQVLKLVKSNLTLLGEQSFNAAKLLTDIANK